jgi:cytochrome c peroxidase
VNGTIDISRDISSVRVAALLLCAILSGLCLAKPGESPQQTKILAPGYGDLNFPPPVAGTYKLPPLSDAKDAIVLNVDGEYVSYHDLFADKYTLLSFMYTRCGDVNGCPLTHVVFSRIRSLAQKDPLLSKKLKLISMSFDPKNDTPDALKKLSYGHAAHKQHAMHSTKKSDQIEWLYLTADSEESLKPILDNYNQPVINIVNENGLPSGKFSHILRVYLIDREKKIRNIYSVSFLHPEIIISDIKTLIMSENRPVSDDTFNNYSDINNNSKNKHRIRAGDHKEGYHSADYRTDSTSLLSRQGKTTDLLKFVKNPMLGLPEIPVPKNNPISAEKIQLGKKLFFDRRLSLNDTLSCAMCHIPEQGFTSNELKKPVGFEGRPIRRNAPTLFNTAYSRRLFHDSRETSLENQIWSPLTARNEMAMPSIGFVLEKIRHLSDYSNLFEQAFDGKQADIITVGQAIASYERTLVSGGSAFDHWYYGNEENAISVAAKRGFYLFEGKAQCATCHTVEKNYALFTDHSSHNTGVGWKDSMGEKNASESIQVGPGRYYSIQQSSIESITKTPLGDLGLYEITQNPADRWRYKTPSLRNVALTEPYMHNGSLSSLYQVVEFYNQGGFDNKTISPLIKPLNLSPAEVADIVAFLLSLTGVNVEELVLDAFTATIGDTRAGDSEH